MTPRRRQPRLYWRVRGGERRAYGDFRAYADVGGRQERLIAPGERLATSDPAVARVLFGAREEQLRRRRQGRALNGGIESVTLEAYAAEHLIRKAKAGKVTADWISMAELYLTRAVAFFGADRELEQIGVTDVQAWAEHLATTPLPKRSKKPPKPGATVKVRVLGPGSVRHALNAMSNLYRRAQSESKVPPGCNPVSAMLDKPAGARREAKWFEIHEGALLLESARTLPPDPHQRDGLTAEVAHALLATFLLTGGRSAEILGLELSDVSFDRGTITFRLNDWRRLKTLTSARVVPLWPQLAEILQPYIFGRPLGRLLFPSFIVGREAILTDWRGTLDRIAVRAGWKRGEVRSKAFRHTYCAARLQTVDGGAPVSPFTVSRELGHGSRAMVEDVYAHLGTVRHRSEVVEYRVGQHRDLIAERLAFMENGVSDP
jgi:integrase